jgi:hypothetical protein
MTMEFWVIGAVIAVLLFVPPFRGALKLWLLLSLVLVWILDSAARDAVGD